MTAAATRPLLATASGPREQMARVLVLLVLCGAGVLGAVLLVASTWPSATLAGRLLQTAGEEARAGAYTEDLFAHLDERLRFAASVLLVLAAGLVIVRDAFEDLVANCLESTVRPIRAGSVRSLLAVSAPTLLAVGLRAAFLRQPMRYDEALAFNEFASRPLYYGLSFYPDPNNHLLNTLLVHLAYVGLGNQPWVLRLPAFLGGVLLVPATWALARLLYGTGAAVCSAALVAVSSYLVEYSTNSRGYTLQALCFVLLLSLVVLAVRHDRSGPLLVAALVAAIGAYALPTMLYGVAIAAVWLVLEARRRAPVALGARHLVATGLVLGLVVTLLYLPVMVVSGPEKLVGNRFVVPLDSSDLAAELPRSLARTWGFWNRDVPLPLGTVLLVGFGMATAAEVRRKSVPLGVLAVSICLVLVLLQRVAPFERVWLFVLPLYFVVASGGLARFVDGRLLGIVFGAIVGLATLTSGSILRSTETGAFRDAEAVARTLAGRLGSADAVLTQLPASLPELQYYFPRAGLPSDSLVRSPRDAEHLYVIVAPDTTPVVAGWGEPDRIASYPESELFQLRR